jgi:hypothetical protein
MKNFQQGLKQVVVSSSSPTKIMKSSLQRKFSSHNNLIAVSMSSPAKFNPDLSRRSSLLSSQSSKFSTVQKSISNTSTIPVFLGQLPAQMSISQEIQENSVKDESAQSEEEYSSSEE